MRDAAQCDAGTMRKISGKLGAAEILGISRRAAPFKIWKVDQGSLKVTLLLSLFYVSDNRISRCVSSECLWHQWCENNQGLNAVTPPLAGRPSGPICCHLLVGPGRSLGCVVLTLLLPLHPIWRKGGATHSPNKKYLNTTNYFNITSVGDDI